MEEVYNNAITTTETAYEYIKKYQSLDENSKFYGSYIIPNRGYRESSHLGDAKGINIMVSLYCCKESSNFKDDELLERTILMIDSVLRAQNEDGTLNQIASNYRSTSDTAFAINIIYLAYEILNKEDTLDKKEKQLKEMMELFFKRSAKTLLEGGFHTPNHRWIIANALINIYRIQRDKKYLEKAKGYLAEGIDLNSDGEYSEKSIGKYDAMVNEALLDISKVIKSRELIDVVKKNIELLKHFIQPDGTIYTAGSKRQDYGSKNYPIKYLRCLIGLYLETEEKELLEYAKDIGKKITGANDKGLEYNILDYLLLNKKVIKMEVIPKKISTKTYEKWYKETGFVRIKRNKGEVITINEENTNFLNIQRGDLNLDLNFTSSFFSRGAFKGKISKIENGYRISHRVTYGYIKPMETKTHEWHNIDQGDWCDIEKFNNKHKHLNWDDIDHGNRETCNELKLDTEIDILILEDDIKIKIKSQGPEDVISKLDFKFDTGGILSSDNFVLSKNTGDDIFLDRGTYEYSKGLNSFCIINNSQMGIPHICSDIRGGEGIDRKKITISLPYQMKSNEGIEEFIKIK